MTDDFWRSCYYSDAKHGHLDPFCTDGGEAKYGWTYTTRMALSVGLFEDGPGGENVVYIQVPHEPAKTEPDYLLCTHHAASWRAQVDERTGLTAAGEDASYQLRSLP